MNNKGMGMGKNVCKCPHHSVMPILIVLFALVFLLGNLGVFSMGFVNIAWPIIVGAGGIMKMMSRKCTCCSMQ